MREELFDAEFAAGVNISFSLLRGRGEMRQESSGRGGGGDDLGWGGGEGSNEDGTKDGLVTRRKRRPWRLRLDIAVWAPPCVIFLFW